MVLQTVFGIFIPFIGTALGACCVLLLKGELDRRLQRSMAGFAAGVMAAASVWSLLIPAIEGSAHFGRLSFLPAAVGYSVGFLFLLILDFIIPQPEDLIAEDQGGAGMRKIRMMVLAVTLHNIPEGMAVGVAFAAVLVEKNPAMASAALALSVGIAVQNFPEGAIVSMPLLGEGVPKGKTFLYGVLSGIVEPIGALLVIAASGFFVPVMPYLLSFAAGAMIYVVVEELIPEMSQGEHSNIGTIAFTFGFIVMMALDVGLG